VSAKAGSAGTASISFTGVDLIGEGISVGSASISGNYTINAVPKPIPTPVAPKKSVIEVPAPTPLQGKEVTAPVPEQPAEQPITAQVTPTNTSFIGTIGSVVTLGTGSIWVAFAVVIILAIVTYVIYTFVQKKRKNLGKIK
jgi:hypothetical protein